MNVYQPDDQSPYHIKVNGNQLRLQGTSIFDVDLHCDDWLDIVQTMLHNEYGDLSLAPVHHRLVRDNLPVKRQKPPSSHDWRITSSDLTKAERKATAWLAAAGSDELRDAVRYLDKVKVKILLESGTEITGPAMVRMANWYKSDNLDGVIRNMRRETFEQLLKHGLDPCLTFYIEDRPWTLLHHLCANEVPEEDIKLLLSCGAKETVNHRDPDGNTPLLLYAARTYHNYKCPPNKKGFKALLDHGADASMVNNKKEGVVQLIMGNDDGKYGKLKLQHVEYLVKHGAEPPEHTTQPAGISNGP